MSQFKVAWHATRGGDLQQRVVDHLDHVGSSVERPAAVFDIDDTLLFNSPTEEDAIAPNRVGQRMFRELKRRGIPIYAVTARSHTRHGRDYASDQLRALGYRDLAGLYMTPRPYMADPTPGRFKSDARARIEGGHGRNIVLCVGDQITDIVGPGEEVDGRLRPDMYYGLVRSGRPELLSIKLPEFAD
jgi:hypothetical protein